jgi:hypothetical protein
MRIYSALIGSESFRVSESRSGLREEAKRSRLLGAKQSYAIDAANVEARRFFLNDFHTRARTGCECPRSYPISSRKRPFSAILFATLSCPFLAQDCHNDIGGSQNQPPVGSPCKSLSPAKNVQPMFACSRFSSSRNAAAFSKLQNMFCFRFQRSRPSALSLTG